MRKNKVLSKSLSFAAILILLAGLSSLSPQQVKAAKKTRTVTDFAGRTVEIPDQVKSVACLVGPSYEKVFMLGEKDKIAMKMPMSLPWAFKTNPDMKSIIVTKSYQDPNIEELLAQKIDVVLFWDYPEPLKKMTEAGIPVVVTQKTDGNPESMEDFVEFIKNETKLFGEVLGPKAKKKSDEWCAYLDLKIKYVTSRVSGIPEEQRPKVYYVRGPQALTTHGRNSYTMWYVEMAGGNMVSKNTPKEGMTDVSMEEVLKWNPDVIFMGRVDSTDLILKDSKWADIKAVKDGKVYVNPNGVMYWDYGSEGALLLEYLAKKLHPDLFSDLDMVKEVKEYYTKFYNYKLTDDEANRILQYQQPK